MAFTPQRSSRRTFYDNNGAIYPQLAQQGLAGASRSLASMDKKDSKEVKTEGSKSYGKGIYEGISAASTVNSLYKKWFPKEVAEVPIEGPTTTAVDSGTLPVQTVDSGLSASQGPVDSGASSSMGPVDSGAEGLTEAMGQNAALPGVTEPAAAIEAPAMTGASAEIPLAAPEAEGIFAAGSEALDAIALAESTGGAGALVGAGTGAIEGATAATTAAATTAAATAGTEAATTALVAAEGETAGEGILALLALLA